MGGRETLTPKPQFWMELKIVTAFATLSQQIIA